MGARGAPERATGGVDDTDQLYAIGAEPYAGTVPSYRVTIAIGRLAPGVSPDAVLPAAAAAAAELAVVEASDIAVVSGAPRLVVRFAGEDDAEALFVGSRVVNAVRVLAEPLNWGVTVGNKGRWHLVR